jgi:UDP-perosamine 4-acetyltransferase
MDIVIIGAGGHGKVVLDILKAAGKHKPVGFLDADVSLSGKTVGGLPVIGPVNMLAKLHQQKIRAAIVAVGDNRTRLQYAALLVEQGFEMVNAIHPSASVSAGALLAKNIVIAANATVATESRIEESAIINNGAVVDHECTIGQAVHICPGACLAGRVRVEKCAFVGLGANVIQCLTIGEYAIIGAGAAVIADIPAHATAVGVPARVIKVDSPGVIV